MMNTTRTNMRKATARPMYKVRSLVAMVAVSWSGSVMTGRSLETARLGRHRPEVHGLLFMSLPWLNMVNILVEKSEHQLTNLKKKKTI